MLIKNINYATIWSPKAFSNDSLPKLNSIWSSVQSQLPKNIYNFTIHYVNNTLSTRKNLAKWKISSTADCSFCLFPETLLHVVAGCQTYLTQGRFTWRHDSILHFLAKSLQVVKGIALYADIPKFKSPSIITGESLRPDLLITSSDNCLYVLELSVSFESNLKNNLSRKKEKYKELTKVLHSQFKKVTFVNLAISALGVFASESSALLNMLTEF